MGAVVRSTINCFVQLFTYCHDHRCVGEDDTYLYAPDNHVDGERKCYKETSSIFVAIQDQNLAEVERHLQIKYNKYVDETEDQAKTNVGHTPLKRGEETPMHLACRLGHYLIAHCLLDNGSPAGVVTSIGSPIHSLVNAVKSGYITSEKAICLLVGLVNHGCDINTTDKKGKTALYLAVSLGLEDLVHGLLSLSADANIPEDENKFTALHMAVYQGNYSCLKAILEKPDVQLNAKDTSDRTPLMLALLCITQCVQHEPRPNLLYTRSDKECPVRKTRYCKMAVVELLVTTGADTNVLDSLERNAMTIVLQLLVLEIRIYNRHAINLNHLFSGDGMPNIDPEEPPFHISMFAPLVRLLRMHGATLQTNHHITQLHTYVSHSPWVTELCHEDAGDMNENKKYLKLVNMCRFAIRDQLATVKRLHCVDQLPLPESLVKYVGIEYI